MTRNSELDLVDLRSCQHEAQTPVVDDDGTVLHWLCPCGRKVDPPDSEVEQERNPCS